MIEKLQIYTANSTDPYVNLAIEKFLLDNVSPGSCILYLWQNENTVVIGRNQNPWVECKIPALRDESVRLARRLSGGGAVYHDIGNLNFTFLMQEADYDITKQFSVIQQACAFAGIQAELSGRNDILVSGRKFSGNAFYHSRGHAYHHGTLLIDTDSEKLSRYLTPSKAKLSAKGVTSVRSRVINLRELSPELTCLQMAKYMRDAFSRVYGLPAEDLLLTPDDAAKIRAAAAEFADESWLYGTTPPFDFSCDAQFQWGSFSLQLQIHKNSITSARVYTDAMDWTVADTVERALVNKPFHIDDLCAALTNSVLSENICYDLCQLLRQQQL